MGLSSLEVFAQRGGQPFLALLVFVSHANHMPLVTAGRKHVLSKVEAPG